MANNRTEKATPKRRREARRRGQVARSRELASALSFLACVWALSAFGAGMFTQFQRVLRAGVGRSAADAGTIGGVQGLMTGALVDLFWLAAPLVAVTVVVSLVANLAQGVAVSGEGLKPNLKRLNPAENLKRVISKTGLFEAVKSGAKFLVIGYLVYGVMRDAIPVLGQMSGMSLGEAVRVFAELFFRLAYRTGLFLLAVAAADYAFQRYRHEQQLKMTKQEVKDEFKEMEGNPQIKGRIRSLQRAMARKRMMAEVPKADVVITNPTHFAVALAYRREEMAAPVVVAKGADHLAARIREIAREHEVMIIENPPLARALFKAAELNRAIPAEFFQAVAELLAFVYRARQRSSFQ